MSVNTFGHMFRFTSFGESHGPAIGCVVDGCPPRIPLTAEEVQRELDRRRPGQSRFTTQRQEPDAVKIMSGVFTDESGRQVAQLSRDMLQDLGYTVHVAGNAREALQLVEDQREASGRTDVLAFVSEPLRAPLKSVQNW